MIVWGVSAILICVWYVEGRHGATRSRTIQPRRYHTSAASTQLATRRTEPGGHKLSPFLLGTGEVLTFFYQVMQPVGGFIA